MFKEIKRRIKIAKISAIIFAIIFISMIISNIYLWIVVNKLEELVK